MKSRFIVKDKETGKSRGFQIYIDRETGVNYIFLSVKGVGGLSPLLDQDGEIVITPRDELEDLEEEV